MNLPTKDYRPLEGLLAILKNGGLLFSARSIAQAARVVYAIVVVRALGPADYGVLAYVHAWGILLLPAINMGSQPLLSKSFGESFATGKDLAQRLWTLRLVFLPVLVLGMLALAAVSEPDTDRIALFLLIGTALVGRGMAVWSNHVLVASHRVSSVLRLEAGFRLVELFVASVALKWGAGIVALLAVHAILWILQAVISGLYIRATLFALAWRWSDLRIFTLLKQGAIAMVPGAALFFLLQSPLILGRHIDPDSATLGQLALALQVLQLLVSVPAAIGIASLPIIAGQQGGATDRYYGRVLVPASLGLALLLAIAGAASSEFLVRALFGADYLPAAIYLKWGFFLLLVPLAPTTLLSQRVIAAKHERAFYNAALPALAGVGSGVLAMFGLLAVVGGYGVLLLGAGLGAFVWFALLLLNQYRWVQP